MKIKRNILFYKAMYQAFVDRLLEQYPTAVCNTNPSNRVKRGLIYLPDPTAAPRIVVGKNKAKQYLKCIELMTFERWKRMIDEYCFIGRNEIIKGKVFLLGRSLGHILIMMVERTNFSARTINYKETALQPKVRRESDGKMVPKTIIYYTDDFYPKIIYRKSGQLRNVRSYRFIPAKGNGPGKGFKKELDRELTINPLLKLNYTVKRAANAKVATV